MSTWEQDRMDEEAKRQSEMTFEEWQATYNSDPPAKLNDKRVDALAVGLYVEDNGPDSWPPEDEKTRAAYMDDAATYIATIDDGDDHKRVPADELEDVLHWLEERHGMHTALEAKLFEVLSRWADE